MSDQPDWRALNRANWDERVAVHLGPRGYDMTELERGERRLNAIEEAELGPVAGLRLDWLHEHPGATWWMFACLEQAADGLFRWPDRPWLPLPYSLRARKPAA